MKIMYIDSNLAEEITKIESGGFYEHKREKYDIVDNRRIFDAQGLASGELYELVIEYGYTYFVAQYARVGKLVSFQSEENGRVKFVPMVREIRLQHTYVQPKDAKDIFNPEEVVEVAKELIKGTAYIRINDEYYLINQVINRKSGTKIEAKVHLNKGVIGTKDIVNMEAFLKVMEKTHVMDYSIVFDVKENLPSMTLKMNIGIEKSDWQQTSLFDEKENDKKIENIEIISIENDKKATKKIKK